MPLYVNTDGNIEIETVLYKLLLVGQFSGKSLDYNGSCWRLFFNGKHWNDLKSLAYDDDDDDDVCVGFNMYDFRITGHDHACFHPRSHTMVVWAKS